MSRFFVETKKDPQIGDDIYIEGSDARHISLVLRKAVGAELEVVCGNSPFIAEIIKINENRVELLLKQVLPAAKEADLQLYLLQGIAKGEKMELIIQKAVELGVSTVIPLACERSVVQLKGDKAIDRQKRWQKIAEAAAKQCGRDKIPEILPVQNLQNALLCLPENTQIIMPWESETENSLSKLLAAKPPQKAAVIIGPEGGLTVAEVKTAKAKGAEVVTLGPRILRTETAAVSAVAIIMFAWGDIWGKA